MDLKKIEKVLATTELPYKAKEDLIIRILAEDERVIPTMLGILEAEREESQKLVSDMNVELSRVYVAYEEPKIGNTDFKPFVIKNVKDFYLKWQHRIRCCFKIEGLP